MMKSVFSVCIAILLAVSLMPLAVLADDLDNIPVTPISPDAVAPPVPQYIAPPPPPPMGDLPMDPTVDNDLEDPQKIDRQELANAHMRAAFGAPTDEEKKNGILKDPVVPDDIWDGGYADFPSKDGSVTRVFDNGSVYTTYPDGSKEGVDYTGNRYTKDRDGKSVAYGTDGAQYIKNADGSRETIASDGTHVFYHEDGSRHAVSKDGFIFTRNADGDMTSIGIEGGQTLQLLDADGNYITGEHVITGPDGKKFTLVNEVGSDYEDADEFKVWFESNGVGSGMKLASYGNGTGGEIKVIAEDGTGIEVAVKMAENEDGSDTTDLSFTSYNDDGTTSTVQGKGVTDKDGFTDFELEGNNSDDGTFLSMQLRTDADGNTVSGKGFFKDDDGETVNYVHNENEISITTSNGSFIRSDPKTGATELYFPATGDHIKVNDKGEVEILRMSDDEGKTIEYVDGKYVVTDPDGNTETISIERDPETGETTITSSNGDVYTISEDGKVLKNGVEFDPAQDSAEIKPEDIEGTWGVTIAFSNISSPITGMLQGLANEFLGEDNGIIDDAIDDVSSAARAEIDIIEGSKMRVKLVVEDVTMVYEGKLKGGKLDLKLVSQTADDEDDGIQIPLDKITMTFVRRGGEVVLDGACRIDTFLLKADMRITGSKY